MLHAFSGPFKLAVSLWPLASFVLTLPVLAVVYHRRGRITLASLAWSYLAVLYVLGLACFTCYPLPEGTSGPGITYGVAPQLDPLAFVGDIRRDGVKAVFQVVANVALFVPLGYMLSYGLRWGLCAVSLSGFAVSLLIECSQLTGLFGIYPYAYRTFDVDDLAANTLGGGFVRMSCGTRVRRGWRRALFYAARLFVFLCVTGLATQLWQPLGLVPAACVLLYPFLGGMPYDRLPGLPYPGEAAE